MDSVQYIVSKLNEEPFNMRLRLIDFHEMGNHELLQILIDVFVSIDPKKINPNYEFYFNDQSTANNVENRIGELMTFLSSIIRYDGIPKQPQEEISQQNPNNSSSSTSSNVNEKFQIWLDGLCHGEKDVVYPILEYCFFHYSSLKKRAYLAPFMTPIQLPLDIAMSQRDDNLSTLAKRYQSLQEEFRDVHKQYEEMNKDHHDVGKNTLKEEVESLQEEKEQLLYQVEQLKAEDDSDDPDFVNMLNAITSLRKEEEEEMILNDRMDEQNEALRTGKKKLVELKSQQSSLQSFIANEGSSSYTIMDEIQKRLNDITMIVGSNLTSEKNDLIQKIHDLEQERRSDLHGTITDQDLESLSDRIRDLEEEYGMKQGILEKEQSKDSYSKVSMFKQHVNTANKKEMAKKQLVQEKQKQLNELQKKLNAKAHTGSITNVNHISSTNSDQLQLKVDERDRIKVEISGMQYESLVLERTVDILRNRLHDIQESLSEQEKQSNVQGFHSVQEEIMETERHEAEMDERKGQTLQEISDMITKMTEKLKVERERLQPLIQDLKETRSEFQDIEDMHSNAKKKYDKLSQRQAIDRQELENECDDLQDEWQNEERNYHYLTNVNEIAKANVEKLRKEEDWRNGVEKMLPEFMCLEDLYINKLAQQENLAKQLRFDQRDLKESEQENLKQRQMFQTLERIMQIKHQLKTKKAAHTDNDSFKKHIDEVEAMSL